MVGVDDAMAMSVVYDDGGIASLNITCWQDLINDAYVIGTKGVAKVCENTTLDFVRRNVTFSR